MQLEKVENMTHPQSSSPELINVREVAFMLSLGESSIWRHVKNGDLPKPIKIGRSARWRAADIRALVNESNRS